MRQNSCPHEATLPVTTFHLVRTEAKLVSDEEQHFVKNKIAYICMTNVLYILYN